MMPGDAGCSLVMPDVVWCCRMMPDVAGCCLMWPEPGGWADISGTGRGYMERGTDI